MEPNEVTDARVFHLKVDATGRMVLPAELRQEMAVTGGGVLVGIKDAHGLRLQSKDEVLQQAQEYFAHLAPADRILSEELLTERREEAARE